MSTRFTMVVAVHLLLLDGEKVLLARRFNTGYEDGNFSVPAGHVDAHETCLAAMIREACEEVGVVLDPENLQLAHIMHRNTNRESIDFFFVCDRWNGEPSIQEPNKCDALEWHNLDKLPDNTIDYIRQALVQYLDNQHYSEFGW